jgi:competence protein ComEC
MRILAAEVPAVLRSAEAVRQAFARWAEAEHDRFALWLPALMTAGAVAFFSLAADPPPLLAPLLLAAAAGLCVATWRWWPARAVTAAALAAAVGFAAAQLATWRAPPPLAVPRGAVMVQGVVRAVEPLPEGRRVTLAAARLDAGPPLARLLRIRLRTNDPMPVEAGDTLAVRALLSPPAPPAYPGAWDMQRDAFYQGFGAYGMALAPATLVAGGRPPALVEWLREQITERIHAVLAGGIGAIATTMLTGNTSGIPEADRAAFRDAGLAHLLAIAGLHIGIVMGLVLAATRFAVAACEWTALRWPGKEIAAVAALLGAAGYMALTGAHLPVQRSFAMAVLFTLAVLAGRRAQSLRGLALAMAVLVVLGPAQVMGVSFQMSFAAVLALIVGFERLQPRLLALRGEGSFGRRFAATLAALAATAALAGSFSAPFGAYHFGQVQLYNVLANVLAVPITAFLVMPAGLLALLLMPLHAEVVALLPMGWGVAALLWVAHTVASWPAATVLVPHMPPFGLGLLALGLAWAGLWRTRVRRLGWLLVAAGLASPALAPPPDLLLAADGRMLGFRDATGVHLLVQGGGVDRFTLDAWRTLWRVRWVEPLGCGSVPCPLRPRPGAPAAVLVEAKPPASACAGAGAIVSLEPVRLSCGPGVPVIDRFSLWRQGAYALWLRRDGVRVLSDREARGVRVWVPPRAAKQALPAGLPMAPALPLPPR